MYFGVSGVATVLVFISGMIVVATIMTVPRVGVAIATDSVASAVCATIVTIVVSLVILKF